MSSKVFFTTGGTLHFASPSYVERQADKDLFSAMMEREFCYVLTARQMGKSSLMTRTAHTLKAKGIKVAVLDFTAVGQNLSAEQWYDGLLARLGRQLDLEDELDDYWMSNSRLGPCQRFFHAITDIVLPRIAEERTEQGVAHSNHTPLLAVFIDEVDVVKSLPFSTDEFFAAIKQCYNLRAENPLAAGLTFCLLGVAMPYELIQNQNTTPFNIGLPIRLADFTNEEAAGLIEGLNAKSLGPQLMERILHWTSGHPYLTQKLSKKVASRIQEEEENIENADTWVDKICEQLFFNSRARETDDNLLFVRERLLRTDADFVSLLNLYEQMLSGETIADNDQDDLINQVRLSGIVKEQGNTLTVRNRIYERVFNNEWILTVRPLAEIEMPSGERIQLKGSISLGRTDSNEIVLADAKISRKHAYIRVEGKNEFYLMDQGSRNGTYLNGTRITKTVLLHDMDRIQIGSFELTFHQPNAIRKEDDNSTMNKTISFENMTVFGQE